MYTVAQPSNVRYYPYAYVNGCSVPAGQPATKGPHLLSKGYYLCCARIVKKMQRGNVYQRQRRTPFIPYCFHSSILASKQRKQKPLQRSTVSSGHSQPFFCFSIRHILRWVAELNTLLPTSSSDSMCLQHKSVEVAASSLFVPSRSLLFDFITELLWQLSSLLSWPQICISRFAGSPVHKALPGQTILVVCVIPMLLMRPSHKHIRASHHHDMWQCSVLATSTNYLATCGTVGTRSKAMHIAIRFVDDIFMS